MEIKKRAEESNKEGVVIDKLPLGISSHLAHNKVLLAVNFNQEGRELGFFKKIGKTLQVHICIPRENDVKEWHRFFVLDADDEDKQRNRRLNVLR